MTAVAEAAATGGETAVRLAAGSVFWPCIHGENVRGAFLASVVGMLTSQYAELVGSFYDLASGPVLSLARNTCAKALLESRQEWLWFVDCDTVFSPTVLPRLMKLADPAERPIVSAAVPIAGKNPSRTFSGLPDLFWAAYRYTERDGEHGLEPYSCAAELGELERVDAVGTGCVLIHRSVFEAIGPGPFNEMGEGEAVLGEDLSFCRRADALGIPVHLAGQVRVGHAKVVTL
jgi:GT2 family glycosyltransferase